MEGTTEYFVHVSAVNSYIGLFLLLSRKHALKDTVSYELQASWQSNRFLKRVLLLSDELFKP